MLDLSVVFTNMNNFYSVSILLIVGLCLLIVVNLTESIKCYKYNCVGAMCGDQVKQDCPEGITYCFKSRITFGATSEERSCMSQQHFSMFNVTSNDCQTKTDKNVFPHKVSTFCFCNTDLCNLSVRIVGDFLKIVLILLLTQKLL